MNTFFALVKEYYDFIERHWGDYVGLCIILLGVMLVAGGAAVELQTGKELHVIYAQGGALITTGVGLLKLQKNPKADVVTETETTTTTSSPKKPDPAVPGEPITAEVVEVTAEQVHVEKKKGG